MPHDTSVRTARDLGALLRQRRKSMKLTQAQLAGLSGLSHKLIIDVEHGKPTAEFDEVLQLAATLGIDLIARGR